MPIVHRKNKNDCTWAVWSSVEAEEQLSAPLALSEEEIRTLSTYTSQTRRREFLTVRRLLMELTGDHHRIRYEVTGKPFLENGQYISISHSREMVAMILSDRFPVAIDIEAMRPSISQLATKFISEEESSRWNRPFSLLELHQIWGAKEVLFKIYGKGGVDFKKDLFVEPHSDSGLSATLQRPDERFTVQAQHCTLEEFVVVWACKDVAGDCS